MNTHVATQLHVLEPVLADHSGGVNVSPFGGHRGINIIHILVGVQKISI